MEQRIIYPAFMLPADFPNQQKHDIFVVYHGGLPNVRVCSAHEFNYENKTLAGFGKKMSGKEWNFQCDRLEQTLPLLNDIAQLNAGVVDWSLALYHGQSLSGRVMKVISPALRLQDDAVLHYREDGSLIISPEVRA